MGEIDHQQRIGRFKDDLALLELRDVIRKHITTGRPVALSDEDYYELRRDVARHFDLHPNAVILVGSCKLGFSLSAERRYIATSSRSDLDISVISRERFDEYWDKIFDYSRSNPAWPKRSTLTRALFNGWISS
jgi:hypothetical protein